MKHRYLVIATGLLALTAVIALWAASLREPTSTRSQLSPPAELQTIVPGGTTDEALRVAAQEVQGDAAQQGTIHVDQWVPSSRDDLAKAASLIVVGTVTAVGELQLAPIGGAPFGQKRFHDYTVRVDRLLKGAADSTIVLRQVVSLILVGESPLPHMPLTVGERYLLFLQAATPGVWVVVENPYRYHLVDGQAIPEIGNTAAATLGTRLEAVFPTLSEAALISRIEGVARAYPAPVSIGLLQAGSDQPRTADEALRLAADWFMGGGTFLVLALPESVSYVETTVGEARQLFERNGPRTAPEVTDDARAWVFVAYGKFQMYNPGVEPPRGPLFSTVVVVIPKDEMGRQFNIGSGNDELADLSQLEVPVDVPSSVLARLYDELVAPSSQAEFC